MLQDRRALITYGRKRKAISTDSITKRRRVELDDLTTTESSSPLHLQSDLEDPPTPPSSPPPTLPPVLRPASSNARKLVQMQLNLGAKTQISCRDCGMTYMVSSTEDVALHKAFHERTIDGIEFGRAFRKAVEGHVVARPDESELICRVDRTCSNAIRSRARETLNVAQRELGAVTIPDAELWSDRYKVYMFVRGSRCIGVCLAEKIHTAHRTTGSQPITFNVADVPAEVGISRIWVSRRNRKLGIAVGLLEAVRRTLLDKAVKKDAVAFSQPTESGSRLASRWFGSEHGWLVYAG